MFLISICLFIDLEVENPLKTLKEFMKNNGKCLSLKSYECVILDTFIDFLIEHQENQRSLDDFASIFLFYVKVFFYLHFINPIYNISP